MIADNYVLGFVMAGGRGSRLKVLTKDRCKSAVNILGHHKIFDFVASNIANTGIPITLIATQFESESLSSYVGNGEAWNFDGINRKIEIIDPLREGIKDEIFKGTADSIRKSMERIEKHNPNIVLVLSGDHVYSMDYGHVVKQHEKNDADITIMINAVSEDKVSELGILKVDETGHIIDFAEKSKDREVIESFRLTDGMKRRLGIGDPSLDFLASMGNYVFFWDRLKAFLDSPGMDFGKDIIPAIKANSGHLHAHVFDGYWRDVGKVRDYFTCNMDFTNGKSPIPLKRRRKKIHKKRLPLAQVSNDASIQNAIISPYNIIHGKSAIRDSVLGNRVAIEDRAKIDHCIFLGTDGNSCYSDLESKSGHYASHIGSGSSLSYVILDENVWVGKNVDIRPQNGDIEGRMSVLQSIGLEPYGENGKIKGNFYIEPETGILVIGKQQNADPRKPLIPDGFKC